MEALGTNYILNQFDPNSDDIAVVIKEFTLKKKADIFFDKYSEPYITSIAISEKDAQSGSLSFNSLPFPNVRKGDTLSFDGVGHLIYGPSNPGSFLAYSILFLESDKDVREFGATLESIVQSKAVKLGAKALMAAAPSYGTAAMLLQEITQFVAVQLKKNKDDELYRRNGTWLQDMIPPYDILRTFKGENDYISAKTSVIPLSESNLLGSRVRQIGV